MPPSSGGDPPAPPGSDSGAPIQDEVTRLTDKPENLEHQLEDSQSETRGLRELLDASIADGEKGREPGW